MSRPSVDVIVPFAGGAAELRRMIRSLSRLELGPGDTLTVVDNRPPGPALEADDGDAPARGPRVLAARRRRGSYYARNRGAAVGRADWLVFVDADVEVPADLLDRYLEPPPAASTGVLVGEVVDGQLDGESHVGRFLTDRSSMSQANTLRGRWAYAQTANCAVRRSAFEGVGGFADEIRSGGDADLCFRLRAEGWGLERRQRAVAVHRARESVRAMIGQRARHGAGCAWLDRAYPGSFPSGSWLGLIKWTLIELVGAGGRLARGDRAGAAARALDPVSSWAFEVGRLRSNVIAGRRWERCR